MKVPTIETQNLNRRSVTLPAELEGEVNLLLVAYEQWQQQQIDTWFPAAERLEAEYPTFRYYELPVVGSLNAVRRFSLDNIMRAGIRAVETRARVLTLYVDRAWFNDEVGITTTEEITALLARRDGTILWRATGSWSQEQEEALAAALRAIAAPEQGNS